MAEADEQLELKFRIFDGTDIVHASYSSSTTIATLKQRNLFEWPQDKSVVPKSVNDMKLNYAWKVLENGKTLAESRVNLGDLPGGVITMHVCAACYCQEKDRCLIIFNVRFNLRNCVYD
ncbi:membrane-anchored ubiquitin-fold protein 3 [Phtheirospermum japonicum]|uniref:Membrane-anchored ubiquitin-fold protein 3 n=1 Tax=Phtheirospermum japonicum TaxID=374723 RepID=A0A830CUB5_9LAMI|nr:membrane-anchored ubiquitin-fold protein 3 [Phtheirospermum japonicum]